MDIKTEKYWLMEGNCLDRMKEIPDHSVDMILCDLPYGVTDCVGFCDSVRPALGAVSESPETIR